ncbi:MAG: hypothetical protein B6D61_13925 [Bacteroidetes bacterium 4484_249]|nr:MAG: hypothetical protein B6D61_13925 [Bacteroidetes bacterium 4484_249]
MFLKIKRKYRSNYNIKSFSDEELLIAYKKSNDNKLFGELFERYTHLVFGVCMKYLKNEDNSKDAVMQIFEKLIEDLKTQDILNFKSVMESADVMHQYEKEGLNEKIPELNKAIKFLNEEQRNCIELLYLQNKSYKEVSQITGYSMKKVKSYIQNGKRNLKNYLEKV